MQFFGWVMKTTETNDNVEEFLNCVENQRRKADTRLIVELMERITNCSPRMWGDSIIGFDRYTYKRRDGSEHSFMITGVSPRKSSLTIYIIPGFDAYSDLLSKLGKHKHSSSCLYINKLENVDMRILKRIISDSVSVMRSRYHN